MTNQCAPVPESDVYPGTPDEWRRDDSDPQDRAAMTGYDGEISEKIPEDGVIDVLEGRMMTPDQWRDLAELVEVAIDNYNNALMGGRQSEFVATVFSAKRDSLKEVLAIIRRAV
jgi:hypothetical protein